MLRTGADRNIKNNNQKKAYDLLVMAKNKIKK